MSGNVSESSSNVFEHSGAVMPEHVVLQWLS